MSTRVSAYVLLNYFVPLVTYQLVSQMTWDCIIFVFFGGILRYLVNKYASDDFLDSLTYSSLNQWDSVSEGIYLQNHGISPYDGDVVHQTPLMLTIWSNLLKLTNRNKSIFFLALECTMLFSLAVFCQSALKFMLSLQKCSKSSVNESSKHLLLKETDLKKLQALSLIWYSLNPYSILVSASSSTCIVYNIVFLWINISICKGYLLLASVLCAFGCYIHLYPGYLIFPVLAAAYLRSSNELKTTTINRVLTSCLPLLTAFITSLLTLLWISYIIQNNDWRFLTSVYWHTITVADCTPQMGIYWYMFVEMFEHFREFFTWVFQLLIFILVVGLTLKFSHNPLYICLIASLLMNVLQPYHSIGQLGLLISILPVWNHILKQTHLLFISTCFLVTALILSPLFHYIWLQPGTGNANFYFSASLVHAFGQLDCQNRISGLYTSCAPSPRTVARSSKRIGRSSNYRPFDNDSNNGGGDDGSSDTGLFYKPRRSQPIVHPPSEVPFCENCRALDEEMSREYNSQTGSPVHNITDDLLTHDDEEESRSWVMKMPPGPWWCEDCQESVTSTNLTISQLFAILRQWTPYAQLQLITIVEEIFRRGAHVDDRDGLTDMTLLHFAAKSGALGDEQSACRIANYLLDEGANLEARCKLTDMTPLHYAAYFDCPLIADLLILRGACINARSFLIDNATPLHLAASQLSLGTARILIQAADFSVTKTGQRYDAKDAKDGLGRTPYECLPPSGQLPEPLCTLRDLLSELLRPTTPHQSESIDIEKTILKATSSDPSDYRSDKTTNSIDHPVGEVKYTDGYATSRPTELRQHQQQAQSACNGVDWLVAESGYLSPRTTKVQSVLQTPDNIKTKRPTTLQSSSNNARPSSASSKCSISAKVTLQSLGLSLGDRVCIAPGNSTPTSSSASASVSSKAHPTTPTGISGRIGKLRFCGSVSFASGVWVGVELDEPVGRNNGSVAGVKYFTCPNQHGIFAPIGRVYKTVNVNGKTNWHPIATSIATTTTASSSSSTTHSGVVKRSSVSSTPNTLRKLNNLNEEADEEEAASTPVKRLPSSRSSYSISSTTASLHHQCPSTASEHQHQRTPTPTGMQSPINLSHVTAKIDTGLRIRSPDISQRSQQQLLQLGDRVLVAGQRRGILRFIGETQFAPGVWYGVELEQPVGKNNGSINGVRYFDCAVGHGIFAPVNRIQKLPSRSNTPNPHCATMANRRDTLMSTSYHSEMADGGYSASRSFSRTPWSSTTSPMIGRAVIGRPPLPTELMNALKAVGRMPTTESTADEPVFYLAEGMQVLCAGEIGIVRYIGPITFADGIWLGIELRKPRGRHDGCVAGKRYFTCRPGHGLLVRPARVFCHGINAVNLLPPALAELERQLAAKRQEANSNRSNKVSSTTSISSGDEQSQQQK